jgi:hypothetical protein
MYCHVGNPESNQQGAHPQAKHVALLAALRIGNGLANCLWVRVAIERGSVAEGQSFSSCRSLSLPSKSPFAILKSSAIV